MTTSELEMALTRGEAAKALKLGLSSIDKLIKSGELPSALVCGRRRINIEDAWAFLRHMVDANRIAKDTHVETDVSPAPAEANESTTSAEMTT